MIHVILGNEKEFYCFVELNCVNTDRSVKRERKKNRIFKATIGSRKRSNDGSEPDIHRIPVHLLRPFVPRPVSVRHIVFRIEHSGTLLLVDV